MDIDREIAEKVMGWYIQKRFIHYVPVGMPNRDFWWDENIPKYSVQNWHPSTDIAQAFMVVEKFNQFEIGKDKEGSYFCVINFDEIIDHADTAPLAICKAALKTVEG